MRALLVGGLMLVVAAAAGANADDKKDEKVDPKLLVGKWKQYEPVKGPQITGEFTADGKVRSWIDYGDGKKPEPIDGTYKIIGNKIEIVVTDGDLTLKDTVEITKLTKDEFHTSKEGILKMRRVEVKK